MAHSFRKHGVALAGLGSLVLAVGCGGGGSEGGVPRPGGALLVGGTPTVKELNTPLGLTGSRGSGAQVFVSFNLKDREFNPTNVQLEYGFDVNGDLDITGSDGDPTPDDEFFPCTPVPGIGDGNVGLDSSKGGSDHLFVWNSAVDVPTKRYVTQDYQYTAQGRQLLGSDGQPLFGNTPGIRLRMRGNDLNGRPDRWGPWKTTAAFDLNNNLPPAVTIAPVGINGVTPNATGSAADENVVLNINCIDEDSGLGFPDPMAVAVDYAFVPPGTNLAIPAQLATLVWVPASTFPGTADTGLPTSSAPGTAATYTWDSAKDAGTVNGDYLLRVTPFDSKSELGPTVRQTGAFRLDNYTIFTDAGAALAAPRVGHRATTLADNRVLITGGSTTVGGAPINSAEVFFPGIGQTTLGAIAATGSLATARTFHSQTRLFDDRVLVAGGLSGAAALSSIEIYDPVLGTWTAGPSLATPRARHAAILLASGDVLIAGGVDAAGNPLASAELYRSDTNTVTTVPGGMTAARHSVEGALLPGGKAFLPGGTGAGGAALSSCEIYDPVANSFSSGPAMTFARSQHSVSSATDGRVFVVGGVGQNTIEIYDPRLNTWAPGGANLTSARSGHAGVLLGNGRIVAAGGFNGTAIVGTADEYVISPAGYNAPNGSMRTARRDAAAVILNNGRVLIIGGLGVANATLSSIEIYSPDGGFNYHPTAYIATPAEEQSHAFGAILNYRLVDVETNNAKVLFQYSIAGGPWKACTSQGGPYLDAGNDPDTIAGDVNEGTVSLVTAAATNSLPIDPILKNTVGDHLFIWNMAADIPKADYPSVKVRCIPFGAGRGVTATTNSVKIAKNTRVITSFEGFAAPVHGSVDVWYHLRDIDNPSSPTNGDFARVEVEFGVDLNNDKQILADDGESFKTCTEATIPAGSEGLGTGYTLATSKGFAARGTDPLGWHMFRWDSIRDVGSPDIGVIRTNVILRITPYDNPDLFPPASNPLAQESKGRAASLTSAPANGLRLDLDTVNGLFLTRVENETNSQFFQTFPTPNTGAIPFTNIRLDETIVFTFSQPVDPASVDGVVGLSSLKVMVGTRQILGSYRSEVGTNKVYFYPLLQEIKDNVAKYTRAVTETQTVLFRGDSASVVLSAFVPGTNPETAQILRKNGWVPGSAGIDVANLLARDYASAFSTTAAAGTAAYVSRGAPSSPTFVSSTPTHTSAGNPTSTTTVTLNFTNQISGETASTSALRFRVDLNNNGVVDATDPVVYGKYQITNTAGTVGGTAQSVISFVIDPAYSFPATATILADFSGLAAADGTLATGATAGRMNFATAAGATTNSMFFETFADTAQRETTLPPANTALWNAAGYAGMLTGLRDGGTGADGVPTPDSAVGNVKTFSGKTTYNFTSMTIPLGEVWRFTGTGANVPVTILVTSDVDIAGTLDLSGGDGESAVQDYPINSSAYPTTSTTTLKGGAGIAGGGKGADSQVTSSSSTNIDGLNGTAGTGGTAASAGGKGTKGSSYTSGAAGGGGAGHAQAGTAGGKYVNSTSTTYGTIGTAGTAYGTTTFSSGLTAGSGGGSGTMTKYSSPSYGYCHGGAGGGGGGAVKIICNGTFNLRGTGIVDVSGGDGGAGWYYYAGSGGGGSGGSFWVIAGAALNVRGRIDLRGGLGGDPVGYNGGSYNLNGRYGPFGGHGSAGRVRLEGPNIGTTTTNIIAGLSVATIGAGSLNGGTGARGAFPGSATQTVNIDTITKTVSGGVSYMDFNGMSIPAGVTVTLTGSTPAFIRVTGGVSISGKLQSNGATGSNGQYSSGSIGTYPAQTAAVGGVGGGAGGITNTSSLNSSMPFPTGQAGKGTGGGASGTPGQYAPYTWSWGYQYSYYSGGGGGGSNLLNRDGEHFPDGGRSRYARGYYLPNNTGLGGAAGTPYTNPDLLATTAAFTGGSGGGPGGLSGYNTWGSGTNSWTNFYGGGNGGAGGGAISIDTASTFVMGSAGSISVLGGAGGAGYTNVGGGGGGGGSGGNVIIRASSVTFATSGSTIDTSGGLGTKGYNQVTYNNYNNGGHGGRGGVRIESVTAPSSFLNYGSLLGYSTTTASLTTGTYVTGDTGTTVWIKGTSLAPNYVSQVINFQGNIDVTMEGAHLDPITGARSTTLTASRELIANPVTAGVGDTIDGYIWYRYIFKMKVPTLVVPALPELYDITVNRTHEQ